MPRLIGQKEALSRYGLWPVAGKGQKLGMHARVQGLFRDEFAEPGFFAPLPFCRQVEAWLEVVERLNVVSALRGHGVQHR